MVWCFFDRVYCNPPCAIRTSAPHETEVSFRLNRFHQIFWCLASLISSNLKTLMLSLFKHGLDYSTLKAEYLCNFLLICQHSIKNHISAFTNEIKTSQITSFNGFSIGLIFYGVWMSLSCRCFRAGSRLHRISKGGQSDAGGSALGGALLLHVAAAWTRQSGDQERLQTRLWSLINSAVFSDFTLT